MALWRSEWTGVLNNSFDRTCNSFLGISSSWVPPQVSLLLLDLQWICEGRFRIVACTLGQGTLNYEWTGHGNGGLDFCWWRRPSSAWDYSWPSKQQVGTQRMNWPRSCCWVFHSFQVQVQASCLLMRIQWRIFVFWCLCNIHRRCNLLTPQRPTIDRIHKWVG